MPAPIICQCGSIFPFHHPFGQMKKNRNPVRHAAQKRRSQTAFFRVT